MEREGAEERDDAVFGAQAPNRRRGGRQPVRPRSPCQEGHPHYAR